MFIFIFLIYLFFYYFLVLLDLVTFSLSLDSRYTFLSVKSLALGFTYGKENSLGGFSRRCSERRLSSVSSATWLFVPASPERATKSHRRNIGIRLPSNAPWTRSIYLSHRLFFRFFISCLFLIVFPFCCYFVVTIYFRSTTSSVTAWSRLCISEERRSLRTSSCEAEGRGPRTRSPRTPMRSDRGDVSSPRGNCAERRRSASDNSPGLIPAKRKTRGHVRLRGEIKNNWKGVYDRNCFYVQ